MSLYELQVSACVRISKMATKRASMTTMLFLSFSVFENAGDGEGSTSSLRLGDVHKYTICTFIPKSLVHSENEIAKTLPSNIQ